MFLINKYFIYKVLIKTGKETPTHAEVPFSEIVNNRFKMGKLIIKSLTCLFLHIFSVSGLKLISEFSSEVKYQEGAVLREAIVACFYTQKF